MVAPNSRKRVGRPGVRQGRPSKYPWDKWWALNHPFRLKKGRDFTCDVTTFRQQIRSRATKTGVGVRILLISDNEIEVTIKRF